jgi:hypothetical protein
VPEFALDLSLQFNQLRIVLVEMTNFHYALGICAEEYMRQLSKLHETNADKY